LFFARFRCLCLSLSLFSYIFRTFFKCLFLVTVIAGAHGLWFLPVLLSIFGGPNAEHTGATGGKTVEPAGSDLCGNKPVKPSAVVQSADVVDVEEGAPSKAVVSGTDVAISKVVGDDREV
jgi:hypothetical protein